jgi:hypothetical protein
MLELRLQWLKRPPKRATFYALRAALRSSGVKRVPALLILGHMRSGSSLLLHLLLTNPDIIACGERNSAYTSERDLDWLELEARLRRRAFFRRLRFAVDQINHDKFTPNEELLRSPRVRLIFLVREPIGSISSLINLTRTFYTGWPFTKAVDYYVQRLTALARLAEGAIRQGRAISMTHDDLIQNTSAELERMRKFLGLETGFSEFYKLHDFTGRRGDPSSNIRAGRIVRECALSLLDIPASEAERAWTAFRTYERSIIGSSNTPSPVET